jgi:DNA-binding LytR/AlgR family response regulator
MKIVIIEDEKLASKDLAATITSLQPDAQIVAVLGSVKESASYFIRQPDVDLIFSDIQLGDGLSFEIFSETPTQAPIIFCTAYDEYALNAFEVNGIAYILKPFTRQTVEASLKKYRILKQKLVDGITPYQDFLRLFSNRRTAELGALLVYHKDRVTPIAVSSIAFFYVKNTVVRLTTFDKKTYHLNKTLDDLEEAIGSSFFRVNRQFLINRKAVSDASSYLSRKITVTLSIPTEEPITVSKEKMTRFLSWLTEA